MNMHFFKIRKYVVFTFLKASLILLFFVSCIGPDDSYEGEDDGGATSVEFRVEDYYGETQKASADFENFLKTARFMPNDPSKMTADDKTWFSNNAAYQFNYQITSDSSEITDPEKLNRMRVYIEGALKTLNYIVYTKPFAIATKKMFMDRPYYLVKDEAHPSKIPSAIGTILIMRGLNTDFLSNDIYTFNVLARESSAYLGSLAGVGNGRVFNQSHDQYTDAELAAGKRGSYLLPGEAQFGAKMTLSMGADLEFLSEYRDVWQYDYKDLQELDRNHANKYIANYNGLLMSLFTHEFLHSFLNWNHNTKYATRHGDLTYSYSGMISSLLHMRAEGFPILNQSEIIPGGKDDIEKAQSLTDNFGGHLVMGYYYGFSHFFGYNNGIPTYHLQSRYYQNKLGIEIYQPEFSDTPEEKDGAPDYTKRYSSKLYARGNPNKATDTKSIPDDPFEGITWKINCQESNC